MDSISDAHRLPQRGREHVAFASPGKSSSVANPPSSALDHSAAGSSAGYASSQPATRTSPLSPTATRRSRKALDPRQWQLWANRPQFIAFLLGFDLVATALLAVGVATSWPVTSTDWLRFAALAACATIHIQVTRQQEERRRARVTAVHIDLTGMWVLPAALLLPIELTLFLLLIVRGQRWINSRRPAHRFIFTTLGIATAALAAQRVFGELDPARLADLSEHDPFAVFGMLMASGFVYWSVQVAVTGGALAIGAADQRTLRNVLGSKVDNLLDGTTAGLGIVTAVMLVLVPPTVSILVLVAILGNRLAEISQLQEEADTDSKTGVFNMRGWTEAAERAFERANRSNLPVALIMLDFDHFKWINDSYGHPAGDDVLRAIAKLLKKVTRPTDVVGRFGGEEFVILLADTDATAAGHAARRIREAISGMRINTTGKHGAPVTIARRTTSIGVAAYPDHGSSVQELLRAADAAVYEAKDNGRDQIRVAKRAS